MQDASCSPSVSHLSPLTSHFSTKEQIDVVYESHPPFSSTDAADAKSKAEPPQKKGLESSLLRISGMALLEQDIDQSQDEALVLSRTVDCISSLKR